MAASTQIAFITLASLFSLLLLSGGCSATIFTITNECSYTVWPAILSGAGASPLSTTGFALQPGESNALAVPLAWSGRLWARTSCSYDITGKFSCVTGDCGSSIVECSGGNAALPVTLAEFSLNGTGGLDSFDVSLVEGFNIPMRVEPVGGSEGGKCRARGCVVDLNVACPPELRVIRDGEAVACNTACQGEPCNSTLPLHFIKNACPAARLDVYDPSICASADYTIAFCSTTSWMNPGNGKQGAVPLMMIIGFIVVLFAFVAVVAFLCGLRSRSDRGRTRVVVVPPPRVETIHTDPQPTSFLSTMVPLAVQGLQALVPRCLNR